MNCPRCQRSGLGEADFYRNRARRSGRSRLCRLCHRAAVDDYQKREREREPPPEPAWRIELRRRAAARGI